MSLETSSSPDQSRALRSNAIGLPGVLFQSITTMAPASAVAFSLGAAVGYTNGALPLAVLIALVVCSLIALNIGSLAKYLPSAGGYFTYVSRGLGSQAGWMTGWLYHFNCWCWDRSLTALCSSIFILRLAGVPGQSSSLSLFLASPTLASNFQQIPALC